MTPSSSELDVHVVAGLNVRGAGSWLPVSLLVLAGLAAASAAFGAAAVPLVDVWAAVASPIGLAEPPDPTRAAILWAVRFPRVALAALVGAGLATGGALMQGVFRNPLADPGVLGVTTGAALGAASAQVLAPASAIAALPEPLRPWVLALAAFAGALAAGGLVQALARRDGVARTEGLLLGGIAVNAGAGALLSVLLWIADDGALRAVTAWMMGSLAGATPSLVLGVAPLIVLPAIAASGLHRALDARMLGEAEAAHLGFDAEATRRRAVLLAAVMVGAAVSVAGAVGFVGLVVPQIVRLAVGASHRVVLVGALIGGPSLLLAADLLARTLASPAEIPVGVLTSLIGTPVFVWLLTRRAA